MRTITTWTIPWGRDSLSCELPEKWEIHKEIVSGSKRDQGSAASSPKENTADNEAASGTRKAGESNHHYLKTSQAMVEAALSAPVNEMPLDQWELKGKKVVVVIDDDTRPTPVNVLFPPVAKQLEKAGVREVTVLVALGTHAEMDRQGILQRLGLDKASQYSTALHMDIVNHDCWDEQALAVFPPESKINPKEPGCEQSGIQAESSQEKTDQAAGKEAGPAAETVYLNQVFTKADLVVSIGTIEPHLLAGFGGGLKNIVPGCASMDTIASVHLQGSCSHRYDNAGTIENPVRDKIEAYAQKFPGKYFLVNTVLDPDKHIAGVFCGDPIQAFRQGARLAGEVYGVQIERLYEVVIVNSYPMEADLRQGTKALAHGMKALKEDGLLIGMLKCDRGVGDMYVPSYFVSPHEFREFARKVGSDRFMAARERFEGGLSMDDRYMLGFLTEMARRHKVLVYSPNLSEEVGAKFGAFEVFNQMEELWDRAVQLFPGKQKAAALPYGGVNYPEINL